MKIGAADPEITGLQEIIKRKQKLTQAEHTPFWQACRAGSINAALNISCSIYFAGASGFRTEEDIIEAVVVQTSYRTHRVDSPTGGITSALLFDKGRLIVCSFPISICSRNLSA